MLRTLYAAFAALILAAGLAAVPAKAQDVNQILGMVNQMARIAQQAQGQQGYQTNRYAGHQGQQGYANRDPYAAYGRQRPDYGYADQGYREPSYGRPAPRDAYSGYGRQVAPSYATGNLSNDPERNCWIEMRMRPDRRTGQMVNKKVAVCE